MKSQNPAFFSSVQFIAMIAAMMGLTAISIDAILPAFPDLAQAFHVPPARANDIQQVVFMYMLGFASTQIICGVLSDTFGRKIILGAGIGIYVAASVWVLFIQDFQLLLVARFLQGMGLAAPRVLSLAVVRDVTFGRRMSQIMSYALMIFMTMPILAPFVGQLLLKTGHWHSIFGLFIAAGGMMIIWITVCLPETLPADKRSPLRLKSIKSALLTCLSHKPTMIYIVMLGLVFSMVMIYISQAEQIFQSGVYRLGEHFPLIFGLVCSGQIIGSYTNSRLVMRLGMQRIIKISLTLMLVNSFILLLVTHFCHGKPPLVFFVGALIIHFYMHVLIMPNMNSLLLEPHAQIAGVASALVSSGSTIIGVLVAHLVASHFNGTVYPLTIGFFLVTLTVIVLNGWVTRLSLGKR